MKKILFLTNLNNSDPEEDKYLMFAQKFVDWEKLPYGMQRVDAVRTKDGRLLLTEDEDICEYLYLLDLDENERGRVVKEIVDSMKKVFS